MSNIAYEPDEALLDSCPFCGATNACLYFVTKECAGIFSGEQTLGIFCDNCKQIVTLEWNEVEGDTREARQRAIKAWNRRAE